MDKDTLEHTRTNGSANHMGYKMEFTSKSIVTDFATLTKNLSPQEYNSHAENSLSVDFKRHVGRYIYESGLQFTTVNLPSFQRLISFGFGLMKDHIPTPRELKGWILEEEIKEMRAFVNDIRHSWADTGCSILLDGWTDENGRSFVNILVDCPKGTVYLRSYDISDFEGDNDAMLSFLERVLLEVGFENVVQIITYSTSTFMKEVGKQLMGKYRPIFWSVSASSCIELMLEIIGTMDVIKETLENAKIITTFLRSSHNSFKLLQEWSDGHNIFKHSIIASIQPFLNLENLVTEKESLKKIVSASDSKISLSTSSLNRKSVADLLEDRSFWSGAIKTLKATIPLVRVLELIYKNSKAKVGYIYETIDQAKETIKEEFQNKKSLYMPFWKVIDDVWNEHLYSPLHSAGYFLNPNLFYSSDVYIDPEVATGLCCCIVRSTGDLRVQDLIIMQIEDYRKAKKSFAIGCSIDQRSDVSPELWWSKYGGECPELQRLAIRILSQTCDGGSKYPLKTKMGEALLMDREKQGEPQNLTDLVYLNYNMHIKNFTSGQTDYLMSGVERWRRN